MSVSDSSYSFDKRIDTDIHNSKASNNSVTLTFSKVRIIINDKIFSSLTLVLYYLF